jgi:hypothetical protein
VVTFLDPRAQPGTPVDPYTLRVDLDQPVTIGLLANGFPDSVPFLDHVGQALATLVPTATFVRFDKGNASAIASDDLLDRITAGCGAVVTAYGH